MVHITSHICQMNVDKKRVIVRTDYNVPITDGHIIDDLRLRATLPTLNALLQKGGKIIILTHLGRPTETTKALSTEQLVPWFKKHGFSIEFAHNLETAYQKSMGSKAHIVLVENLRFFPGEKEHSHAFAQELARLGDFYVDDAFGLIHEADTSITLLAELFPPERRTIGLLMEQEIRELNKLIDNPAHPFTLLIGGNKAVEKTTLIAHLLDHIDAILLCPAIVFSYLHAQGYHVGASLVDASTKKIWDAIHKKAAEKQVKIVIPTDYMVAKNDLHGQLRIIDADAFEPDDVGITIGPKSTQMYLEIIKNSKTVVYNGLSGLIERPETLHATQEIFKAMAQVPTSVIGGGDSTAVAEKMHLKKSNIYLSTGGGAMIAYLSNEKLLGLEQFL